MNRGDLITIKMLLAGILIMQGIILIYLSVI